MAIRRGDWKLVRYDRHAEPGQGPSPKTEAARVIGPKLYNLAQDIGESHDLSAQYPEKRAELQAVWQKWNAQLARPLWGAGQRGPREECRLTPRHSFWQNTQTVMIA